MATKFRGRFAALVAVLFNRPLRVKFGSAGEGHYFPSEARVLPAMAGADGEGEGEGDAAAKAAADKAAADKAAADVAAAKIAEGDPDEELLKGARDPDAVRNALKAERERAKAAKKAADDASAELEVERKKVKEFEDRDKSAEEKAEQRAADAEKKADAAEHKLLRLEVAGAKKLPVPLASRLTGETKAELEADADELLKLVKEEDKVSVDGGARKSPKEGADMNARIRELAGRG